VDWLVIADDLTGACDTGGGFAASGLRTRVLLEPAGSVSTAEVVVMTTESRHQSAQQAAGSVIAALRQINLSPGCRVYKKVDSTLRGQAGAEFAAVMDYLQLDRALVCPAFPDQGRTVCGGRVFVHGVPLEDTVFHQQNSAAGTKFDLFDAFNKGPGSRLVPLDLIRQGVAATTAALTDLSPAVFVADAVTQNDLQVLEQAATAAGIRLFCGSAGLARALVEPAAPDSGKPGLRNDNPVLVVAGSRSSATHQQVAEAERQGYPVLRPSFAELRIVTHGDKFIERTCNLIEQGQSVVISTAGLDYLPGEEAVLANGLGRLAGFVLNTITVGGVVLTGGDTAAAVCRALESRVMNLHGEVAPGMAWGRLLDGSQPGLPAVTKAGGFGDALALVQSIHFLRR
jgi:D-threonate/D-erythronate kinase